MKVGGRDVVPPSEKVLVIPRDGEPIVFRARAVLDMNEFEALVAEPSVPKKLVKGTWVPDPDAASYREQAAAYNAKRLHYLVLRTLEPSEITWERTNINDPESWGNWEQELRDAGLTAVEVNRVFGLVIDANMLDEDRLNEAREHFLRGAGDQSES